MTRIAAVLFDWDETLGRVLGDVLFEKRLSELYATAGMYFNPLAIRDAISARHRRITERCLAGRLDPRSKDEWIQFHAQILLVLGCDDVSRETATMLWRSYAKLPFVLYQDTVPTLQALSERGIRLGIITNSPSGIEQVILNLVGPYIPQQRITISEMVGAEKPDREIFKLGAQRVGRPAEACMYVGDSLTQDVIPALENGGYAKALWLNRSCKPGAPRLPNGSGEIGNVAEVVAEVWV